LIFYNSGKQISEFSGGDLFFSTDSGYIDADNSIILVGPEKQEIIEIFLSSTLHKETVDKVILDLGFSRLNTASPEICNKTFNN